MSDPTRENGIVKMDPEHFREIDGVVFDAESYEKHIASLQSPADETYRPQDNASTPSAPQTGNTAAAETAQETESHAPAAVFACDPVHIGWYEQTGEAVRYPIMAGAIAPDSPTAPQHTISSGSWCSSYQGSYRTSYASSYLTSYHSSWLYGSGSFLLTAGSQSSSGVFAVGGYGLELI